ncbi:MAG: hypothetical protein LBS11_09815 [Oscillospiraceae bacterium]|nr:hypothetical protein [Oscillospiraceae bacterium]
MSTIFSQVPVNTESLSLHHSLKDFIKHAAKLQSRYPAFPQVAMWIMSKAHWEGRDFERETLFEESTYRRIKTYAANSDQGLANKLRHWSIELCLAIVAALRLPKWAALLLLGSAGYTVGSHSDDYLVVIGYLLDNYTGRPIGD